MTYDDAQKMLDNPNDKSEIAESVRNLNKIAKIIRQRRMEAGALTLASTQVNFNTLNKTKVKFSFSDETHDATDVSLYKLGEANFLVEEFMLLANIYVAEKILYCFPSNSVLRKHSTPKPKQIKEFGKLLSTLGYNLDYSSSKNLADSLDKIDRKKDPFFNKLVRILTTRTMNEVDLFYINNSRPNTSVLLTTITLNTTIMVWLVVSILISHLLFVVMLMFWFIVCLQQLLILNPFQRPWLINKKLLK